MNSEPPKSESFVVASFFVCFVLEYALVYGESLSRRLHAPPKAAEIRCLEKVSTLIPNAEICRKPRSSATKNYKSCPYVSSLVLVGVRTLAACSRGVCKHHQGGGVCQCPKKLSWCASCSFHSSQEPLQRTRTSTDQAELPSFALFPTHLQLPQTHSSVSGCPVCLACTLFCHHFAPSP